MRRILSAVGSATIFIVPLLAFLGGAHGAQKSGAARGLPTGCVESGPFLDEKFALGYRMEASMTLVNGWELIVMGQEPVEFDVDTDGFHGYGVVFILDGDMACPMVYGSNFMSVEVVND